MFHVLIHPNQPMSLPKWWAHGNDGTGHRVCWGKIGQMTSKNDFNVTGALKRFEKQSEGYLDLGSFNLTETEIGEAMRKTRTVYQNVHVQSVSPEERKLLRSFCNEMKISLSLIHDLSTSTDPAPAAKPKKSRSVKKTAIADLSESWF